MATVIQGRVLDNNLQDLFKSIDQLQQSQQMKENKRITDLKATEDYLSKLAEGNNLGITGVMQENPEIAKRYLALSGVGEKEIDSVYNQIIGQTLTGELRAKEILGEARGRGQGGGAEEPTPKKETYTPDEKYIRDPRNVNISEEHYTPTNPDGAINPQKQIPINQNAIDIWAQGEAPPVQQQPNYSLPLSPTGQVQGTVPTLSNSRASTPSQAFPTTDMDRGEVADTKKGVQINPLVGGAKTNNVAPATSVSQRSSQANVSFGEVKGDRFVSTKYFKPENSDKVVTDLLVSSGFMPDKIEQSDVDFYKSFIANANGVKDFSELAGKAFKIPPRVIGVNEQEIISKLTPELQKKYADLMAKKAEAEKRGNVNGAGKVQEQMNTMTSGLTGSSSPFKLTDREYNELGVIFGVSGKRNIDAALSQFAQMDMGSIDAALKQSQIDENQSQIIRNQVAVERDKKEMQAIDAQMKNGGVSDAQILDYNLKMMNLKKAERDFQNEPAESLRKTEDAFVSNYKKLADTKGVTDTQKKKFIQSQIESNTGVMGKYKQDYLRNAQYNNWGVVPTADMTEEDFTKAQFAAQKELTENLDVILYNHFTGLLGVSREAEESGWTKFKNLWKRDEENPSAVNSTGGIQPPPKTNVKDDLKNKYRQKNN